MSARVSIGKFLAVEEVESSREIAGRPEWGVYARDGSQLAVVEWYRPWRCYVLRAFPRTVWSDDCLADVSRFMSAETKTQRSRP